MRCGDTLGTSDAYTEQTAVLYFQARNGTFKRVPQKGNAGFEASNGGMTIYYTPVISGTAKVTAFKPVGIFRPVKGASSQARFCWWTMFPKLTNHRWLATGIPDDRRRPREPRCEQRPTPAHLHLSQRPVDAHGRDEGISEATLCGGNNGKRALPNVSRLSSFFLRSRR